MPDPTIGYGSVDKPFNEAFGRIISVNWGDTVVIVELPDGLAYVVSNDVTSPDFSAIQRFYATGVEIPKDDWKDHWYLEPINDPDGRYYTSRSFLAAPAGYEGYGGLLVSAAILDPVGDGAYLAFGSSVLAAEFIGINSQSDAEAYYAGIDPEFQPLYTIVHREESGPSARVYNNGEWLRGISVPNVLGSGTDPDDPADSANCVFQIGIPDVSQPYSALLNLKHANVIEVFQNTTNFQDGHSPVPAVILKAYSTSKFKVDATTKRLVPVAVTPPTPKWTKTINLAAYPPARDTDTSLGKFNSKGFALPGDPLP